MGRKLIKYCAFGLLLVGMSACSSVKGIEKYYLSDPNMSLENSSIYIFEQNAEMYREGASGGNGGKAGGGCGCN